MAVTVRAADCGRDAGHGVPAHRGPAAGAHPAPTALYRSLLRSTRGSAARKEQTAILMYWLVRRATSELITRHFCNFVEIN